MSPRGMKLNEQNQSQLENFESEAQTQLRFLDQNPEPSILRSDNKGTRTELSPPSEDIIEEIITNRMKNCGENSQSNRSQKTSRSEEIATRADQTVETRRNRNTETTNHGRGSTAN